MKHASLLVVALASLAGCHAATATPPATAPHEAPVEVGEPTIVAPPAPPAARATGETAPCGLAIFETARGTRIGMPAMPRVSTERLGAFAFLSHVYEESGFTLELDEFSLPTDTGDGRAILEPLANGQVAAQAEWQVLASEQKTIAGAPALVRVYRIEDGSERREVYVARHRLALRLVTDAPPPSTAAREAIVRCFESSLVLPPDLR